MKTISFFILLFFCFSLRTTAQERRMTCRFLFSFGEKGEHPGQFNHPLGVSSDASGNIYVADTGNNRMQKFNSSGKLVSFIGGFGWEKEQFQSPVDIFVYNSLDVYLADFENSRIERYNKDLNWITSYYSNDSWQAKFQFEFPRSVFMSLHGDFFIVDSQNNRITKLSASFEPELTFGDFDWGQGVLEEPSRVYVANDDNVYVSDSAAGKIRVYDYYGNFLTDIGEDILRSPKGLCVTAEGHIFTTDSELNQIIAFDKEGRVLLRFGSSGKKFGAFMEPFDVDVNGNRLLVADASNHRIQVFKLLWND